MLYNVEEQKVHNNTQCARCKYFDKDTLKCSGLNKKCFEYDPKTKTIIDGITKMPIKNI